MFILSLPLISQRLVVGGEHARIMYVCMGMYAGSTRSYTTKSVFSCLTIENPNNDPSEKLRRKRNKYIVWKK